MNESRTWSVSEASSASASAAASASARALQDDIRLELESHLELATDDLVAAGGTPESARAEALRRFGDIDTIAGQCLGVKRKGELAMKGLVVLLVAALVLVTTALAFTAIDQRRRAERELVIALDAQRAAQERFEAPPILLGAEDRPRVGDLIRIATTGNELDGGVAIRVDNGGMILLRDIGRVLVTDKTRTELESWLSAEYSSLYAEIGPIYVVIERSRTF